MDGNEKNKETLLTLTTNNTNTIIYNEINFPYEELKKHLYLHKKELYNNLEINFDDIMKNYIGISTLILSKKNNPTLDLTNDIILSIKAIEQYKNFPYEKIYKDLENYYKNKLKKKKRNIEIEKRKEKLYNKLYNNRKRFIIGIYTLRRNKSCLIERKFNKLNFNESDEKKCKKKNKTNIKSKKILFDNYKVQFEKNLDELYNEGKITFIEKINFKEFILLMKKNGYLNIEDKANEINLAKQIFDFLQFNKMEKYILVKNLFIFTLSILNLNHNNDNNEEENFKINNKNLNIKSIDRANSDSTYSINKISNNFNLNFFFINSNQSKKIFNDYNILYYNWKKNQTNLSNNINKNLFNEKNFSFKSNLNNLFNTKIKNDLYSHISKDSIIKRINKNLLNNKLKSESQECMVKSYSKNSQLKKPLFKYLSGKNQIKIKNKSTISPIKDYNEKIIFTKNNTINNIQRIRNHSFKEIKKFKNKSLIKSNKSLQKFLFPNNNININNNIESKYCITENDINEKYKSRNIQKNNIIYHHKNYSFDNFNKKNKKIKSNKLIKRNKVNIITNNIPSSIINQYNSFSSQNNLKDKPLFILDINLINKNKQIYIYKGINVDKTISDFVDENKIDDPYKVEFIKRLIYTELEKFN